MKAKGMSGVSASPGPHRRRVRPRQLVAAGLVVAMVGSVLAVAQLSRSEPAASPEPAAPQPDPTTIERPLRSSDEEAGSFSIQVPGGWPIVETAEEGFVAAVDDLRSEGNGAAATMLAQLRPAVLPPVGDEVATAPVLTDPADIDREAPLLAVDPEGQGYLLVTTSPARGSTLDEIRAEVAADEVEQAVTDRTIDGLAGFTVRRPDPTASDAAEVVHDVAVVASTLFILSTTGSAPPDLLDTVVFDTGLPDAPRDVGGPIHADQSETRFSATIPARWVEPPVDIAGLAGFAADVAETGDVGLAQLLAQLLEAVDLDASAEGEAMEPVFLAADPFGRSYLMISSVDVGGASVEAVLPALSEAAPGFDFATTDDIFDGWAGVEGTRVTPGGDETTSQVVVLGQILVMVTASGPDGLLLTDSVRFSGVPDPAPLPPPSSLPPSSLPPVSEVPVVTIPPVIAPPVQPPPVIEASIPLGEGIDAELRFVFPDGWDQVPADATGYDAYVTAARRAGRGPQVVLLDGAREVLIFELPDLPFQLDIELPQAAFIGAALSGDGLVAVQIFSAEGRNAEQIGADAVDSSREAGRTLTAQPLTVAGFSGVRLVDANPVGLNLWQDLFVVDDTVVAIVRTPQLPTGLFESMRIE